MSLFRLVPPAGTRVRPAELITIARHWSDDDMHARLKRLIGDLTGKRHVFLCSSGRAAQTIILEALASQPGESRREVVIPGYTCYSVAASIERANLLVRPVDIDTHTMDYDFRRLEAIDFSSVLAINASNLFGIPSDAERIEELAARQSVHVIDDAAQVLGVNRDGRLCGTNGDAGFFSLDRGKNLSGWSGGIIVTDRDDLAEVIRSRIDNLPALPRSEVGSILVKYVISSMLLHPLLYWLPNAMPFLKLGETVYDPHFAIEALGSTQAAAAVTLLPRLEQMNGRRRSVSQTLLSQISELEQYRVPGCDLPVDKVYLRLPLLAASLHHRDHVIELMSRAGIKATAMYPGIVADIAALKSHPLGAPTDYPGSRAVAERLFTLPTHGFVSDRDVEIMLSVLKQAVAEVQS